MAIPLFVSIGGGQDVLLRMPDRTSDGRQQLIVQGQSIAAPLSAKYLDKDGSLPAARHEFVFTCETRTDLKALRAFFLAHKGRAAPFWFPTWEWELEVPNYHDDAFDGFGSWLWLYSRTQLATYYALGTAYRYVAFFRQNHYRLARITAAVANDPAGSGLDRFSLNVISSSGGENFMLFVPITAAKGIRPVWLRYGRFDSDAFRVDTFANGGGEVTLAILEVPDEAPT